MSTPFLQAFTTAVLTRLLEEELVELRPGEEQGVVHHVAAALARVETGSLISSLSAALLSADGVEELWADNDELKRVVDELGRSGDRGVGS
ncbi:MAG: hypothetical protein H6732_03620 [Alphaproteobacteria bacterium]|nr:hypothetical protein [Alphaproteobacteria bacterium]